MADHEPKVTSFPLNNFRDGLSRAAHGMTKQEALAQGICINCKKPPTFQTQAGRAEYPISGLCEPCFDKLFSETESEEENICLCGSTDGLHDDKCPVIAPTLESQPQQDEHILIISPSKACRCSTCRFLRVSTGKLARIIS